MKQVQPSSSRAVLIVALLGHALAAACFAQTAVTSTAKAAPLATAEAAPVEPTRPGQVIQHIRTEDAGTRIDELRVGGETQSITVQPKTGNNLPAYEVKPSDSTRGSAPSSSKGDTNGSRVWNVLKF